MMNDRISTWIAALLLLLSVPSSIDAFLVMSSKDSCSPTTRLMVAAKDVSPSADEQTATDEVSWLLVDDIEEEEHPDEALARKVTTTKTKKSRWDSLNPKIKERIIKAGQERAIANKKKREPHQAKKRRMFMFMKQKQLEKKKASRVERPLAFSNRTALADLTPGMELPGVVISLTPFGAYVDVGTECDGLLHISQLTPDVFVSHPRQLLSPGQKVTVRVRSRCPEKKKLHLAMLSQEVVDAELDDTAANEDRIQLQEIEPNDELWGVLKRVTDYGAYVEVGAQVDGFLHFMDHPAFSYSNGEHPSEYMAVGDRVRVWALDVDLELQRLKLTANRPQHLPGPRHTTSPIVDEIEEKIKAIQMEIRAYIFNPSLKERQWISVRNEDLDLLLEKFSRAKFEIEDDDKQSDRSKLRIISLQSAGHQAVIGIMHAEFGIFCRGVEAMCGLPFFSHGGGLTKIGGKRRDPDNALKFQRGDKYMMCLIFEVELHNRTIRQVHERMVELMSGWPTVVYGVACKFYSRRTDGAPFQGVVMVYEKTETNGVKCAALKDIGTTEFDHFDHIPRDITDDPKNFILKPTSYPERKGDNYRYLSTSCLDFYEIVFDKDVLCRTMPENLRSEVDTQLSLNMFRATRALDQQKDKNFSMPDHEVKENEDNLAGNIAGQPKMKRRSKR